MVNMSQATWNVQAPSRGTPHDAPRSVREQLSSTSTKVATPSSTHGTGAGALLAAARAALVAHAATKQRAAMFSQPGCKKTERWWE